MAENEKDTKDYTEKRKYPRILIRIKCKGENNKYYSKDLSCEGIFLSKCTEYPAGNIMSLEFKLPGTRTTVKTRGIVCWVNNEGSGIRFLTLSVSDFDALKDFLSDKQ